MASTVAQELGPAPQMPAPMPASYALYFLYRRDFLAPCTDWQFGLLGAISGSVLALLAQGKVERARKLWILGDLAVLDWNGKGDDHTVPVWVEGAKEWNSWYLQADEGGQSPLRLTVEPPPRNTTETTQPIGLLGTDPAAWQRFVRMLYLYHRVQGRPELREVKKLYEMAVVTMPRDLNEARLRQEFAPLWPRPWRWPLYLEADLSDRLLDHWQQLRLVSTFLVKQREVQRQ